MIINQCLIISWMRCHNCINPRSVTVKWQTHSGGYHLDCVSILQIDLNVMPYWICLAIGAWHQNSLVMLQYTHKPFFPLVTCVINHWWDIAKLARQCNNVTTAQDGTYITIQKHPNTAHNCADTHQQGYLILNHCVIATSMKNTMCCIDHHLNGYCKVLQWLKRRWDLVNGPKDNVKHIYIQCDWVYTTGRQNAVRAMNNIKCPIPTSWQTETTVDMFIEAPMHLLFLE